MEEVDPPPAQPRRFHGEFELDATCLGRDAGKLAEDVISHLSGLVGAKVKVTLEVTAEVPSGVPTKRRARRHRNLRTMKYFDHGFEMDQLGRRPIMFQCQSHFAYIFHDMFVGIST